MKFHSGCILGVPCAFTVTKVDDVFPEARKRSIGTNWSQVGSFGRAENEK